MKKAIKNLSLTLLVLALLTGTLAMTAFAVEGYSGTPASSVPKISSSNYADYGLTAENWQAYDGYYAITTAEELYKWASVQGNAALFADIVINQDVHNSDASTLHQWTPVNYFKNTFDGRGHSISGLYVNGNSGAAPAVFEQIDAAGTVKNVVIKNSLFVGSSGTYTNAATIACTTNGTLSNVLIEEDVKVIGYGNMTGLVTHTNASSVITNCVSLAYVEANSSSRYVGALFLSYNNNALKGTVTNCFYISGRTTVGTKTMSAVGYNQNSFDTSGAKGLSSTAASHTCIAMDHPAAVASCYVKGSTAYSDCMICGKILSGTKSVTDYSHDYADATCTAPATCSKCGATTGDVNKDNHTATPTISAHDSNAELHNLNYSCCGTVIVEAHSFDSNHTCACTAQAAAAVTIGSTTTYYVDFQSAVNAAKTAATKPSIKLLANVTLTEQINIRKMTQGMELDFAGKTIYCADTAPLIWLYDNGTLTLRDSVGSGGFTSGRFSAFHTYSPVEIYGGTFRASVDDDNTQAGAIEAFTNTAKVTIHGGTFYSTNDALLVGSGAEVIIYGGSFTGVEATFDLRSGSIQVYAAEFPEGIIRETYFPQYDVLLSDVLAPDCYLKDANGNLISTEGDVYAVTGPCTVSEGADLSNAVITVNGTHAYIGVEIKPDITVSIHGRVIDPAYYTLTYANNTNVGEATVTVTGKDPYSGSNSATFEITKGSLKVETAPETTFEFGDTYVGKAITGGKVVIVGNESAVITGTWNWVEGTNTAAFTPDAQYADLFETFTDTVVVTQKVTAATPVLTIATPSPSIMPGMAIRMSVVAQNPYNAELTDLPTQFRITYRIGENGTPITVDGLEFTLPSNVALGETVYVWVQNVAVSGKYTMATSVNTIQLTVGQVDYTQQIRALEEAIEELKNTHGADISTLEAQLEALKAQLAALDDTYATEQELADAIAEVNKTIADLANRVKVLEDTYATKAELEKAIKELETLIAAGDQASIDALNQKVDDLRNELAKLEAAMMGYDDLIYSAMAQTKAELETLIANAKAALETAIAALEDRVAQNETDIAALQKALAEAIENLNKAIAEGDAANTKALTEAVAALEKALADAVAALEAADATNRAELVALISEAKTSLENALAEAVAKLEKADADNKAALEKLIADTKAALETAIAALEDRVTQNETDIAALQKALAEAIENLNKAIAEGDAANTKALTEAVAALEKALADAVAALEAADATNRAELVALISEAKTSLENALAEAVAKLEKADADNKAALEKLIADTKAALETAIAALEDRVTQNETDIAALQKALAEAIENLNKAIAEGDAELGKKIANLTTALDNAIAAYKAADEIMKAELIAKIEQADAALQAAIDKLTQDLNAAKEELNAAIASGDTDLNSKISALNTALDNAIAAYQAADAAQSAELTNSIKESVIALDTAIKQVQKNLDDVQAELAAKDRQIEILAIIACIISGVALCGSGAFVVWFFIDRKKRIYAR